MSETMCESFFLHKMVHIKGCVTPCANIICQYQFQSWLQIYRSSIKGCLDEADLDFMIGIGIVTGTVS